MLASGENCVLKEKQKRLNEAQGNLRGMSVVGEQSSRGTS